MTSKASSEVHKDIYTCYYCGIKYLEKVECSGIYYCPNPLCTGPGGAWFRIKLESYKETGSNGRHTVDHVEWLQKGIEHIEKENFPQEIKDFIIQYAKTHDAFKEIKCY